MSANDSPSVAPRSSARVTQVRLPLGQIVATPGALALLEQHRVSLVDLLLRHATGDWGDVCAEDAHTNDEAIIHGGRVLSCYSLPPGASNTRLWIISESDRSVTTALRPSEY